MRVPLAARGNELQPRVRAWARAAGPVLVLAAVLLAATVGGANAGPEGVRTTEPTVGLAINPPGSTGALNLATGAGARGTFVAYTWAQLEPSAGRYDLRPMDGLRYLTQTRGLKLLLGLEVVNTTERETPRDLDQVDFDSPRLKQRFRALVDALRPHLNRNVAYVSIGNELDIYLGRHPASFRSYTSFYEDAVSYLHEVAPWIKVGVSTTFSGAVRKQAGKVAVLNRVSDVHIHTYYPVHRDFLVRAPNAPFHDFPQLLRLAGKRPVVFQEVGYPESSMLSSSRAKQARFVANVFGAWRRAGNRVPFLSFYALHDLPQRTCEEIAGYYRRSTSAKLKAFLCSLGLREESGAVKPAWTAFVKGASRLR